MAMLGSFAIGTGSVTTKMYLVCELNASALSNCRKFRRVHVHASNNGHPLGALSVIVAAVFASFLLNKRLGHLGRVGCTLCILRSSITVLHAPEDQELETVTQFLEYSVELGAPYSPSLLLPTFQVIDASPFLCFLFYFFTVLIFSLIMAYDVARDTGAPTPSRTSPSPPSSAASPTCLSRAYASCSSSRFPGENQFVYPSMYLFVVIAGVCIMVQLNYANKALDLFSVDLGSTPPSASSTVSLLSGFIVTFLGVHILNLAMLDESEAASRTRHPTAPSPSISS
ncbi:magnesium transporter NIPA-domain-containing protein [Mycena leptocephala]|nr:magnesium transporter NIPA-domain-containing protein [Mycena leptocephala]